MEQKFITLREVTLNNNCPECYSRAGLQLTFKQRFIENSFYKAISKEISHALFCQVCESIIFPVRWTDDIDRVYKYQQRATHPKPTSIKLKTLAWVLVGVFITILTISALIGFGVFMPSR